MDASSADTPSIDLVRFTAIAAARDAAGIIRDGLGRIGKIHLKGAVDIVTEFDRRAEQRIVGQILQRFPDHRILAEEGSTGGANPRFRWIIDPIDGTTNYAHGIPFFSISIAYEQDGELHLGVVLDPMRDELFLGQRGAGAWCNDQPLGVAQNDRLIECVLATGFPYDRALLAVAHRQFAFLSERARAVRRLGSAALDSAYVAAGRFDAYWESVISPWDIAAGSLIAREAGALVTDLHGGPFNLDCPEILISSPALQPRMIAALSEANQTP